jgi:sialic acid synthase SpsE
MIIAEIGLNHLGDRKILEYFLHYLSNTVVDAVTLQIREQDFYNNSSWSDFELNDELYKYASVEIRRAGKKFGLAVSNKKKINQFKDDCDFFKILSKDLGNSDILTTFKNTDVKCYLSTGNASFDQIEEALKFLNTDTTLIHTRLDNRVDQVNLSAINTMRQKFLNSIAFGNHCENLNVLYTSTAFSPSDYFFYIKDNTYEIPPDNKHAVNLSDVDKISKNIVQLKKSIGTGIKTQAENTIKGQI